jgi:hypothetical protein
MYPQKGYKTSPPVGEKKEKSVPLSVGPGRWGGVGKNKTEEMEMNKITLMYSTKYACGVGEINVIGNKRYAQKLLKNVFMNKCRNCLGIQPRKSDKRQDPITCGSTGEWDLTRL